MGASESKSKLVPFEKITLNVLKLLTKLEQMKEPMNATVKDQILVALEIYSKQILNKSLQDTKEYLHASNRVIKFAKDKVNEMPKSPEYLKKIENKSAEQLTLRLMEAVKKLNCSAVKDYQRELNEVTSCFENLKQLEDYVKLKNFAYEESLSELFLMLFIGTTSISLNTVDETLEKLNDPSLKKNAKIINYIHQLKSNIEKNNTTADESCLETIPVQLENMIESTKRNYSQLIDESQNKICDSLQTIENFLNKKDLQNTISGIFKHLKLDNKETWIYQTQTVEHTEESVGNRTIYIDDILEEFLPRFKNCADKFELLATYFVQQLDHNLCDLKDWVVELNNRVDITMSFYEKSVKGLKANPSNYLEEKRATKHTSVNNNGGQTEDKDDNVGISEETANSNCDLNTGIMQVDRSETENTMEDSTCERLAQSENYCNPIECPSNNDNEKKQEDNSTPDLSTNKSNEKELSTLETLEKIKTDVLLSMESFPYFRKKKQILLQGVEEVQKITTTDEETKNKKTQLLNKLEGFLVAESLDYLENLERTVEHYKSYAEQFPFPDTLPIYDTKKEEIESQRKHLDDICEVKYCCIDSKRDSIDQQIDEALNILENKAKDNNQLLTILQNMEEIENKIGTVSTPDLIKPLEFRQEMDAINELNHFRLMSKKKQITQTIYQIEENYYDTKYNEIKGTKKILDDFLSELKSRMSTYEDNDNKKIISPEDFEVFDKYKEKSEAMDKLIEEIMDQVKRRHKAEDLTSKRSLKRSQTLYEVNVNLRKLNTRLFKEGLSEKEILINQLKEDVRKQKYLTESDVFKQILDKVFIYKQYISELPDDSELTPKKNFLSQELENVLRNLDQEVAERVINKKHTENIIELSRQFSTFEDIPTEKIDIIKQVKEKAESYKPQIDFFLGSSSSVDYYIVEEKLQRLMEKLDELNCTDANMINQLVETMNYIKECISKLELNASNEI